MTTLAEVEAAALSLPENDRITLGVRLMGPPPGSAADGDLATLVAERWAAYQRGDIRASAARDVIARMRAADAERAAAAGAEPREVLHAA